jgi:hypothetical protein
MDSFFKKIVKMYKKMGKEEEEEDDFLQKHVKNIMDKFASSFHQYNPLLTKYYVNDLRLLCVDKSDETALFTIPRTGIVTRFYFEDEPFWHIPERHELKVGLPSTLDGVQLLPDSSDQIEYVLYPFEQGCDLPLKYLIPTIGGKFLSPLKTIYHMDECKLHHRIKWTDEFTLLIDHDEPYKIIRNDDGTVVSGFIDESAHFQIGDACTLAHLDDQGNLIVCQGGDVSSVVIVKNTNKKKRIENNI